MAYAGRSYVVALVQREDPSSPEGRAANLIHAAAVVAEAFSVFDPVTRDANTGELHRVSPQARLLMVVRSIVEAQRDEPGRDAATENAVLAIFIRETGLRGVAAMFGVDPGAWDGALA
jgi:hypothetical protein